MNQFPQYAQRPVSPAPHERYLDPVKPPRTPPRLRAVLRRAVLLPLACAGVAAIAGWAVWAGFGVLMTPHAADAAPVVSARPTAQPGPAIPHERSPKVPKVVTEDGMYIVGKQIATGTYRATCGGRHGTCVWQRYQVIDGVTTAVAAGTAMPGQTVLVELSRADFSFGVLGFGEWTLQ